MPDTKNQLKFAKDLKNWANVAKCFQIWSHWRQTKSDFFTKVVLKHIIRSWNLAQFYRWSLATFFVYLCSFHNSKTNTYSIKSYYKWFKHGCCARDSNLWRQYGRRRPTVSFTRCLERDSNWRHRHDGLTIRHQVVDNNHGHFARKMHL